MDLHPSTSSVCENRLGISLFVRSVVSVACWTGDVSIVLVLILQFFKTPRNRSDPNNFWVPNCGTAGLEKEVIIWEQDVLRVFSVRCFLRQFSESLFFQASLIADPKATVLSRLSAPDFLEGEISKEYVTDRNIRWCTAGTDSIDTHFGCCYISHLWLQCL